MDYEDFVKWLGHASFLIKDENGRKTLFLDPSEIKSFKEKADVVLVTHAHYDHWNPKDLQKIVKDDTTLIAVKGCNGFRTKNFVLTSPGKDFPLGEMKVRTIPAYNIKPERVEYHPKANSWVGYILNINGKIVYHAGDTDFIPEMRQLKGIDLALLPIGGTFTMDVDEAVEAANTIKARVTAPIHYRRLLGDKAEEAEERFKKGVKGETIIFEEH